MKTISIEESLDALLEGGRVENVENAEVAAASFNDFNHFNGGESSEARSHPIPEDSILQDFLMIARTVSEAPDSFSIAPMLAVCAKLLTPDCYWNFAGKKYPNLYQFVVGPPGVKKSTSFKLAEIIGDRILLKGHWHRGNASDSALFEKFELNPHRLHLQSEANPIISNWIGSHAGKETANRYLDLYDGEKWSQTYKHQKSESESSPERVIEEATLSVCFGGTFNCCRFGGVDAKSGLQRRFGYYVAEKAARLIEWPEAIDGELASSLVPGFSKLADLRGAFSLAPSAKLVWSDYQRENRAETEKIRGIDEASDVRRSALAESPSRVLKLAAIFRVCRWAKHAGGDPLVVDADSLRIAIQHQAACIEAVKDLESIGRRAEIEDDAERILSIVRADHKREIAWETVGDEIRISRSELTRKFAANTGRGGLTPNRLHHELMPALEARGDVRIQEIKAKGSRVYFFKVDPV